CLLGSSSANSSPEFPQLRSTRKLCLSAFLSPVCVTSLVGAELEDVKKLLKGRSSSVSPTRSSSASITLPVPKKSSAEPKTVSYDSVRSGQYDTLDAAFPTFSWSTTTLPSSSIATVAAGNTSSYTYQVGQAGTNNMPGGSPPISPVSPPSLSVYGFQNNLAPTSGSVLTTSGRVCFLLAGYGVQKNVSNSGGVISSAVSTTTRSQADDAYRRDYKYVVSEKENVPARRDAEMLILAKDSGKQFTTVSSSLSGDSIKKEKLISSYVDTAQLKAETGNSYCEHGPHSV
uniref:Uncharacterized protein n=1 Tax=Kryptolebias marmoratus TaxID=37003 RepID=A0A3Q3BMI0_KRYMA